MLQGNFFTITSIHTEAGLIKAVLELNPEHKIFEGHFPGVPVVPGVCMMQMIKELMENVIGGETAMLRADHIKFLAVINPQENKMIQAELKYTISEKGEVSAVASLFNNAVVYFKFKGLFK